MPFHVRLCRTSNDAGCIVTALSSKKTKQYGSLSDLDRIRSSGGIRTIYSPDNQARQRFAISLPTGDSKRVACSRLPRIVFRPLTILSDCSDSAPRLRSRGILCRLLTTSRIFSASTKPSSRIHRPVTRIRLTRTAPALTCDFASRTEFAQRIYRISPPLQNRRNRHSVVTTASENRR